MALYVNGGGRQSAEVRKEEVTAGWIGLYSVPRLISNPPTNAPPLVPSSTKS